jgi:hypothetical protein
MSKSTLLSTMARAVGIPARIHMVDIINHKISQRLVNLMGTKAFHCHAYSEMYLNNKWVKAAPIFDKETCIKGNFFPMIEFDGESDALFAPFDTEGKKFVEYIGDWGSYADVPQEKIHQIFCEKYPHWYPNPDSGTMRPMEKEPLSLDK